jgi:hypothetical protein
MARRRRRRRSDHPSPLGAAIVHCDLACPYWQEAHGNIEAIVCCCGRLWIAAVQKCSWPVH